MCRAIFYVGTTKEPSDFVYDVVFFHTKLAAKAGNMKVSRMEIQGT